MAETIYDIVEIKKRVADKLEKEFPNLDFSIRTDRRGVSSLAISLRQGNIQPFLDTNKGYVSINVYSIDNNKDITEEAKNIFKRVKKITDEYNWDRSDIQSDYFDVNFYLDLYVGISEEKPYKYISGGGASRSGSFPRTRTTTSTPSNLYKGTLIKECAGWKIYKKVLNDGRVVYGAYINADTPQNKGDWGLIKGEILTETSFKWGKFGNFEKWRELQNESDRIDKLCTILNKYYSVGASPATPSLPAPPTPASSMPTPSTSNAPQVPTQGTPAALPKVEDMTKQDIERLISTLEIVAGYGNQDAINRIKVLKIVLQYKN